MWQIKVVISPLSQGLWISNLERYWLFCGCYDRGLHRRKLDNPGISLLLSVVVKKSILYEMSKKPPRYKGKLVLTKNKRKNQKCRLELRVLRSTRFWIIQKFVCITTTVNPVALKLEETATGGVQYKKLLLKILQNWQENICVRVPHRFFSSVLWIFWEHFFDRTFPGNCFSWIGLMVKNFNSVSLILLNSQLYHAPSGVMTIMLV